MSVYSDEDPRHVLQRTHAALSGALDGVPDDDLMTRPDIEAQLELSRQTFTQCRDAIDDLTMLRVEAGCWHASATKNALQLETLAEQLLAIQCNAERAGSTDDPDVAAGLRALANLADHLVAAVARCVALLLKAEDLPEPLTLRDAAISQAELLVIQWLQGAPRVTSIAKPTPTIPQRARPTNPPAQSCDTCGSALTNLGLGMALGFWLDGE